MSTFYVYILECRDGSYYVGQTDDLDRRLDEHASGGGCRHTARRLPVRLVWSEGFSERGEAKAVEEQLKRWSRAKKRALIGGDIERGRLAPRRLCDSRIDQVDILGLVGIHARFRVRDRLGRIDQVKSLRCLGVWP